jgi:hypothetical protein
VVRIAITIEERIVRLARSVAAIAVALAVTSAGFAVAQATPMPNSNGRSSAGVGAVTVPAKILPNSAHVRAHSTTGAAAASLGSLNWSGYVATGDTYTSVSANWVQPQVTCTTKGIVSFWVGLDGWNNGTVEQTGTGVDCRTGSPQYYAWWETFPTNSQQTYATVPVLPGDQISSTVSFAGGQYTLLLTDSTQNWTRTTVAAAPTGAANASAEVVAEAASLNSTVTQLADFGTALFSGATIDDQSLTDAGAQPVDMFNNNGSVIAKTAPTDAGGDFAVTYTGGVAGVHAAFQAADGTVHNYAATGDAPLKQAMMAGTNPSVAPVSGGAETAYQSTTGFLMVTGPSGTRNTGLGMMAGTSPSITALAAGGFAVAFQANTEFLWTYTSANVAKNLGLGMNAGSSPSITQVANGSVQIAFEANTNELWQTSGSGSTARTLKLGMAAGTSPSITAMPTSGYMIAVQANSGLLWTFTSTGATATGATSVNQSLGMMGGTSPSIAASASGGYGVAFQANTGTLWTFVSGVGAKDQGRNVMSGTSPAIVGVPGGYETAYQADTGAFEVTGAAGDVDPQQGAAAGTSPDIAP